MAEAITPPNPFALYLCRNSLGGAAYLDGRFANAHDEFATSLEVARRSFGADHFHVAEAEVNLAWVELAQGHSGEALDRFQGELTLVRNRFGEEHPRFAEVLSYVARLRGERGDHAEASRLLTSALDLHSATSIGCSDRPFRSETGWRSSRSCVFTPSRVPGRASSTRSSNWPPPWGFPPRSNTVACWSGRG